MKQDIIKAAVVTGAAGITGFAISQFLIEDGYQVVMADLASSDLESKCEELGDSAHLIFFDAGDAGQIKEAAQSIREKIGKVSVLVNNAGVLSNKKAVETTAEEWRRLMSINLDGAFLLSREFLPGMVEMGWGRIINMCSLAMKTGGLTAGTAYTASKGGMAALTLSLAREFAPHGITANGISPAYIMTPMITEFLSAEKQAELLEQIPVRRFCEPKEVANVVRFLISPLSGFITGEIIDINGGLHMD